MPAILMAGVIQLSDNDVGTLDLSTCSEPLRDQYNGAFCVRDCRKSAVCMRSLEEEVAIRGCG